MRNGWLLLSLGLSSLGLSAACDGPPPPECMDSADCGPDSTCVDGECVDATDAGVDAGHDAGPPDSGLCPPGAEVCGESCCGAGELCGQNLLCCAAAELCGTRCCGADETCEGALCRPDCGAQARCRDASGVELCCGPGETCASGRCVLPGALCSDSFECSSGERCHPRIRRCLPEPDTDRCVRPTGAHDLRPTLVWQWDGSGSLVRLPTHHQVTMSPVVASLNDDDGDGDADADDIPDVVFHTFAGSNRASDGVMRALNGADGSTLFDVTESSLRTTPSSHIAVGDIDGDGRNELVTCGSDPSDGQGPILAFNHDGSLLWRAVDSRAQCGAAGPSIADLDGDGQPEVIVRYTVLDGLTGGVEWHRECIGTGGWASATHLPCDYTVAADLDGDGRLEVVGGNIAYRADGSPLYDRTADFNDGYPAVADLDLDGNPEVVVVHSAFSPAPNAGDHWLRALAADGTDLFGPVDINAGLAPAGDVSADTLAGGGPPTIANLDDDPEPEIGVAGAYAYAVFENDGTRRWASFSDDRSSRKTGSSAFDFDGDGRAEVLYADHYWLRLYDGRTGNVRSCICNTSDTLFEYPVVADVDADGHAEIVVASNDGDAALATCPTTPNLGPCELGRIAAGEDSGTHGVRVFRGASDWVSTRRVWNQHAYHVTHVSESGRIPPDERPHFRAPGLNGFRTNAELGAGDAADLLPVDLAADLTPCNESLVLHFAVLNQGWATLAPGASAAAYVETAGAFVLVGRVITTRALEPGQAEGFALPFELTDHEPTDEIRFRVVVNDDGDMAIDDVVECRADNNTAELTATCSTFF